MKEVLVAGQNKPLAALRVEVFIEHGADTLIEHAIAVLPRSGPDRPWLPMQDEAPHYAPQGDGPAHFWLDLARLHPDTDRLQLVLQSGSDASTLNAFNWVRASIGDFVVDIGPADLAVSCVVFAEIYRKDGGWKIRAKNEGVFNGIEDLGKRLGLAITDKSKERSRLSRGQGRPPASGVGPGAPAGNQASQWSGSAFLVADGHLITNAHVVDGAARVMVTGFGGRHEAAPVIVDHNNDLALIRIPVYDRHTPLSFRTHPGPVLGEQATSIGFPLAGILGSGAKLGEGIVSGLLGPNDDARTFQITSPIQPGSSGGPILDESGLIIGVVTSTFMGAQNVNLAIRGTLAASLLEAAGVPARYVAEGRAISMSQLARDCVPLVWRLECQS